MAEIAVVGLDIGKRLFHLVGMDRAGRVVLRRRCSRSQLFAFFERLPPALVGMEACAGAHFIGRTIRDLGHDARLIPARFVKPFLVVPAPRELAPRRAVLAEGRTGAALGDLQLVANVPDAGAATGGAR